MINLFVPFTCPHCYRPGIPLNVKLLSDTDKAITCSECGKLSRLAERATVPGQPDPVVIFPMLLIAAVICVCLLSKSTVVLFAMPLVWLLGQLAKRLFLPLEPVSQHAVAQADRTSADFGRWFVLVLFVLWVLVAVL